MSQVINTNVASLNAQNALNATQNAQKGAMEKLASGKSINRAADDAAGLAIGEAMTAQIKGTNQAIKNTNDGISYVQTAEGALNEISTMMQRIRELKVQDLNGTLTSEQSGYLDTEFAALVTEIVNVIQTTEFNDKSVLSGESTATGTVASTAVSVQAGWEDSDTISIASINLIDEGNDTRTDLGEVLFTATGTYEHDAGANTGLNDATNTSLTEGSLTLQTIDDALDEINSQRATLGATQNRLEHNAANLANVSENMSAARSQIMDADFAAESAELARTNVLQQAGMSMLAQANQAPNNILALVR